MQHASCEREHKADALIRLSCVLRLGSVFPFDVAAYAGLLFGGDRFAFEDCIEGSSQVPPAYGDAVSRPAVVHLIPINVLSLPIK